MLALWTYEEEHGYASALPPVKAVPDLTPLLTIHLV